MINTILELLFGWPESLRWWKGILFCLVELAIVNAMVW